MKIFKKLKEYLIQDEETFNFLINMKLVDENMNQILFKEQLNREKFKNSLSFPTSKSHLLNNATQNMLYFAFDNRPKDLKKLKELKYEERKDLVKKIMTDTYSKVFHSFINFLQEGQKIISIKNKELVEQFENTSLKNLKFQDFNVFLDCFYLSIEKKFGNTYVDGFIVQNEKDCFELTILVRRDFDNSNESIIACLYKDCDIETAIKMSLDELQKDGEDKLNEITNDSFKEHLKNRIKNEEDDDKNILSYSYIFLINVFMFFNTQRNKNNSLYEIKEENKILKNFPKKDKSLPVKISNSNYYYYLSSNSSQNREFKLSEKDRKINKMFVVSGHYRNQPIGSKDNVEYKVIWIEPFLKGEGIMENKTKNIIL